METRRSSFRWSPRASSLAFARGPAFFWLAVAGLALLLVPMLVPGLAVLGLLALHSFGPRLGLMLAALFWAGDVLVVRYGLLGALVGSRRLAQITRRLSDEWLQIPIRDSYVRATNEDVAGLSIPRLRWMLSDSATWWDILWMVINASFGWLLAVMPLVLAVAGLIGCVGYGIVGLFDVSVLGRVVLGLVGGVVTVLAVWSAPLLLQTYGALARAVLGPREDPELAQRVRHLAQTRAETIDASAAEIRRIERDLHDGAQARLVAMGMTLSAAEDLLDTDPEGARQLLVEARQASGMALADLRALVSGIHPPVLADRGLVDAIRALALDSVPRVEVTADPIGRPPAPIESAAYFAVSELLANVTKHAESHRAWIEIRYQEGKLAICVADDGRGGADAGRGTGLRGIQRRLAAFDGAISLQSPSGGPTLVQMEIPCEL
ncbi:MAG TPA: histidine kinase [Acidimicrobiales bacterium]